MNARVLLLWCEGKEQAALYLLQPEKKSLQLRVKILRYPNPRFDLTYTHYSISDILVILEKTKPTTVYKYKIHLQKKIQLKPILIKSLLLLLLLLAVVVVAAAAAVVVAVMAVKVAMVAVAACTAVGMFMLVTVKPQSLDRCCCV